MSEKCKYPSVFFTFHFSLFTKKNGFWFFKFSVLGFIRHPRCGLFDLSSVPITEGVGGVQYICRRGLALYDLVVGKSVENGASVHDFRAICERRGVGDCYCFST